MTREDVTLGLVRAYCANPGAEIPPCDVAWHRAADWVLATFGQPEMAPERKPALPLFADRTE